MSARPQRIEVITRGERRRRWSMEAKQAIVAESLMGTMPATAIARKHGIGTGQLYSWRHELLGRRSGERSRFAEVGLLAAPAPATGPTAPSAHAPGTIEIGLPSGITIRVDAQINEPALRHVLAALRA